jgi:hypothetical protein
MVVANSSPDPTTRRRSGAGQQLARAAAGDRQVSPQARKPASPGRPNSAGPGGPELGRSWAGAGPELGRSWAGAGPELGRSWAGAGPELVRPASNCRSSRAFWRGPCSPSRGSWSRIAARIHDSTPAISPSRVRRGWDGAGLVGGAGLGWVWGWAGWRLGWAGSPHPTAHPARTPGPAHQIDAPAGQVPVRRYTFERLERPSGHAPRPGGSRCASRSQQAAPMPSGLFHASRAPPEAAERTAAAERCRIRGAGGVGGLCAAARERIGEGPHPRHPASTPHQPPARRRRRPKRQPPRTGGPVRGGWFRWGQRSPIGTYWTPRPPV